MKNKNHLTELASLQNAFMPPSQVLYKSLLADWGGEMYSELAVILSCLKTARTVHQNGHWTARGDSFYGDHLLFERLYNEIVKDIDSLAEKTVGLSSDIILNPLKHLKHQYHLLRTLNGDATEIPNPGSLSIKSLSAESLLQEYIGFSIVSLECSNILTVGLNNLLEQLCDNSESRIYLLKQRSSQLFI